MLIKDSYMLFNTNKKESLKTKLLRIGFNLHHSYFRSGGTVSFIASDYTEIHVKIKYSWLTRNPMRSVFGGLIYASIDPIYVLMFLLILDKKTYIVWDKSATIKFIKPIYKSAKARFIITPELLENIKKEVAANDKSVFELPVEYVDNHGNILVAFTKTIYIAKRKNK